MSGEEVTRAPSPAAKILGVSAIAGVWIVVTAAILVTVGLLFLWVEGKYALGPERSDVVSVVKLRSMASDTAGGGLSETYVVRFMSGDEAKLTLPPGSGLSAGERIRLKYRRSRMLGAVVPTGLERLSPE